MGYDPQHVARRVRYLLVQSPGRTLCSVAAELGIDRHTITRALNRVGSVSFHELQSREMALALRRLNSQPRLLLQKERAAAVGCSCARLRAWETRLKARGHVQ